MSGKPYPEGVKLVMELLEKTGNLEAEIANLEADFTPKVKRHAEAKAARDAARADLRDLLEEMDLEGPGNYGFGGRMAWFLEEMRRQIRCQR